MAVQGSVPGASDARVFLGREIEQRQLTLLIANARNSRGGSIILIGEPGIGKTALLDVAAADAAGMQILRIDGHESEATMPYAGLHRLTLPFKDLIAQLPQRHQQALEVAAGTRAGPAPDRYLVGLGLLELLADAASSTPVVCLVDDAHLLDPESLDALAFVARRLVVEPVALLFAARDERDITARMGGVAELTLSGLSADPAMRLLAASADEPIDPAAAAQIAHATGGNPLALIDLAATASSHELSELGIGTEPVPIGRHLETHYVRNIRKADEHVQEWMLLASADSTGSIELTSTAAVGLGLDETVLDRAEAAGLVQVRDQIRFRHPLVRSAVYNSVDGASRRRVHRALSTAAASLGLPELETWHASRATLGTDAALAERLEQIADVAGSRGGFASRASTLVRASELTPAGRTRDSRRVAAAEAALGAGAAQLAARILDGVDAVDFDPVVKARVLVVRSALAMFAADAPALASAPATLIEAADLFHGHDPVLEQRALLRAFEFAVSADRLIEGVTHPELGERFRMAAEQTSGPLSTVLRGLGALIQLPYAEAVPLARTAFDEILGLPDHEMMQMGSSIASLGTFLWDESGRAGALERAAVAARDAGALQIVDALLWIMSLAELTGGSIKRAVLYTGLVREVRRAMGYDAENVINASVMAWTGSPRQVVLAIADGASSVGFGGVGAAATAAVGLRDLAEGNYRDAYDRLKPLVDTPFLQVTPTQYPDFVEAAARTGRKDEAARFAGLLTETAVANESEWCRGVAERAAGLACEDGEAEKHFKDSLVALESTQAAVDLARTHLVYGEWLRRARRRADAGRRLQEAIRLFEHTGADMFLPRAHAELEASGIRAAVRRDNRDYDLTIQELTVARAAAVGRTNAEIASELYISPNTVDYHLRKVFQKLGVSSRRQLADKLKATDG